MVCFFVFFGTRYTATRLDRDSEPSKWDFFVWDVYLLTASSRSTEENREREDKESHSCLAGGRREFKSRTDTSDRHARTLYVKFARCHWSRAFRACQFDARHFGSRSERSRSHSCGNFRIFRTEKPRISICLPFVDDISPVSHCFDLDLRFRSVPMDKSRLFALIDDC